MLGSTTWNPAGIIDPELWWDVADPAAAEARFARLGEELALDGVRSGRVIAAQSQLARAQAIQGHLDDAERTLDDAERRLDPRAGVEPRLQILLERGRLLTLRKLPVVARIRFISAFELATQHQMDFYAIDAAQMMSVIEPKKAKHAWTVRAIAIAEGSTDPGARVWLGPLYADLGHHFEALLQLDLALAHFDTSVAYYETCHSPLKACESGVQGARVLRLMNRPAEALALQRRFEAVLKRERQPAGHVQEEIAECLLALKQREEAATYFDRAYTALSTDPWLRDNHPSRLRRLKELGKSARRA